jgi:prepilin-type N-terminal cleavage/methylation domain-containing protein
MGAMSLTDKRQRSNRSTAREGGPAGSRSACSWRAADSGFTLLELLAVIAIIAILASLPQRPWSGCSARSQTQEPSSACRMQRYFSGRPLQYLLTAEKTTSLDQVA